MDLVLYMGNNIEFASKPKENEPWDVVIIGSGPASLTAAIYTTRGVASTLVLGGEKWGGQLMLTTDVDNFPGFPEGIQGPELMVKMRKQAERFGAEFVEKNVESVEFSSKGRLHKLTAGGREYLAKSIIVATGAETRWLGIPGEDKLRGRGISSCAPCDAPFFKDKKVAVIGGGDSAMEEALVLTKYASQVVIIYRKDKFRASKAMQEKVFANKKIKVIWDSVVEEFVGRWPGGASSRVGDFNESKTGPGGEDGLEKLRIKNIKSGKVEEVEFDGTFIAIGHTPATAIIKGNVELDEKGFVVVKDEAKTNISGVFVAGDVHDYSYKQAVTAAGFGCMAGMETLRYLDKLQE